MSARVQEMLATDDQPRRALRLLGGLLLGIGMLLVFVRRSGGVDGWSEFPLFLVLLAPCLFLYGTGLAAARREPIARGWESAFVVFGLLLIPFVGFQLVELLDGNTASSLNVAWIFALTALAGFAAELVGRVRFGLLLAALAAVIAWLALWDEILAEGLSDVGTLRGMLVLIALILAAAGFLLARREPGDTATLDRAADTRTTGSGRFARGGIAPGPGADRMSELVTGAGVAAVAAGAISIGAIAGRIPFADPPATEASLLWDVWLLVASLALIGFGAWVSSRGPAYVGAVGILFFVLIVGFDLDDESPAGKLLGWPLIVLVLGALAFLASLAPGGPDRFRGRGTGATAAPPPPPEPPPPRG